MMKMLWYHWFCCTYLSLICVFLWHRGVSRKNATLNRSRSRSIAPTLMLNHTDAHSITQRCSRSITPRLMLNCRTLIHSRSITQRSCSIAPTLTLNRTDAQSHPSRWSCHGVSVSWCSRHGVFLSLCSRHGVRHGVPVMVFPSRVRHGVPVRVFVRVFLSRCFQAIFEENIFLITNPVDTYHEEMPVVE